MATYLNKLGLIGWLSKAIETGIGGLGFEHWLPACSLLLLALPLCALHVREHDRAHHRDVRCLYGAGLALGAPPFLFALLMAAASNIMMTLTHYATGTSPVVFGSGYTTLAEWWKAGFVMSLVLIAVSVLVGAGWWKLLWVLVRR